VRGLTAEERVALVNSLTPADPNEPDAEPGLAAIYENLTALGRCREQEAASEDYAWVEWRATDLGRLALRVCPVGEP